MERVSKNPDLPFGRMTLTEIGAGPGDRVEVDLERRVDRSRLAHDVFDHRVHEADLPIRPLGLMVLEDPDREF